MNIAAIPLDMSALAAVHWLRPHWLWLLAAVPALAAWWRAHRRRHGTWRDAVDPHLLPHLLDDASTGRARAGLWLGMLGAALAICALAGPSWQRGAEPPWQSRAPLVIALDLSSPVLASDLPPSRLAQARARIAQLLQARAGGQVALVVFADDAHTVAPLTDDAANLAVFLDALAPDIMPVDGSRADRAIAWSARLLRQAGSDRGDILLLTDHADGDARAAAAVAARNGYRVSAIGLGTAAGAAYRDADGRIGTARLDAASLRALASAGNGRYAPLTAGDGGLASVDVLDAVPAASTSAHGTKGSVWRDQGYWLLPPLLMLAAFAFRRGGALGVLLLCALLPWQPAHAATQDWWRRPDQQAHAHALQGAEAYRREDYAGAAKQWAGLAGADAAYNRGNALAKQGDYDAAIAAYDDALRLRPGMADAIANRKAVEAAKRRKPPQGRQSKPQQQHDGKGHAQPNQQAPEQRQQGQGDTGEGSGRPQAQPEPSGRTPSAAKGDAGQRAAQPQGQRSEASAKSSADASAQRRADAAQRQAMQQALRKAEGRRGAATQSRSPPRRAETAAERERRLANEAWLRRVPDDPGGLLRARFRLEYERRQQQGGD